MITRAPLLTYVALGVALAFGVPTGTATAQEPVHWKATVSGKKPAPGAQTEVKLTATIDEGWHIYSLTQGLGGPTPTKITMTANQPFVLSGKIKADPPDVKFDSTLVIELETYENTAEFTLPIRIGPIAKAGPQIMEVAIRYQACNASTCLPPRTDKIPVAFDIQKAKQARKAQ